MSNKRRRKSIWPKIIFFILFVTAAIITVFSIKIFREDTNRANDQTQSTLRSNQTNSDNSKSETSQTTTSPSDTSRQDYVKEQDVSDPNLSPSVTGSVSKAFFTNSKYRISVTTDQALSEGTCNLEFWSDFNTLTATSEIIAHPNSSSCTFDLDAANVISGFWNLRVTIYTTQNRYGIIEDKIEIVK